MGMGVIFDEELIKEANFPPLTIKILPNSLLLKSQNINIPNSWK